MAWWLPERKKGEGGGRDFDEGSTRGALSARDLHMK